MDQNSRFRGCFLGLAVGDAIGAPREFYKRGTFEPLTDMIGGGAHRIQPGQWTDDTSMALCLATSLVEKGGFDPDDQMQRYCRWEEEGYLTSTGYCFGKGRTVAAALRRYRLDGNPYAGISDPMSAGNGCIMRLAPIPIYYFPDLDATERFAIDRSRTTHGTAECIDACRLFARMIHRALRGESKESVLLGDTETFVGEPRLVDIARGTYRNKPISDIRGSAYVSESLEAALWAFHTTESFADAVLAAANLGHDADMTAAVCGQVAGAFYGEQAIPPRWIELLALRDEISRLADALIPEPGAERPRA